MFLSQTGNNWFHSIFLDDENINIYNLREFFHFYCFCWSLVSTLELLEFYSIREYIVRGDKSYHPYWTCRSCYSNCFDCSKFTTATTACQEYLICFLFFFSNIY